MEQDEQLSSYCYDIFSDYVKVCSMTGYVSSKPLVRPQLYGYFVFTISSNIDNNKFKNLRDCDILIWAEYAANANKKLVNITPIVSGTNTLDNPNNYPTISNKLSIFVFSVV